METQINPRKSALYFFIWWILIFGLCIVARLPHFLSKDFWFDGDEAIVGIMAQDLLDGKSFPIYFSGQNYGLSTFEAFSTAFFEFFIGPSIWSLRLGALLLFSLGITFLIRTVQLHTKQNWVIASLAILLVTFPSWYLWGAMVRGGYITAFLFSCIIFYLLFGKKTMTTGKLIFIGIATGIIFEAHLLILLSISSLLLFWLSQQENKLKVSGVIIVSFIVTVLLFRWIGYSDVIVWDSPKPELGWTQFANFKRQQEGFLSGFNNFFHFGMLIPSPSWWTILGKVFLIVSFLCAFVFFITSKNSKIKILAVSFLLSTVVYLLLVSTVRLSSPRYWIGFFNGLLFLLIYIGMTSTTKTRIVIAGLAFISFFGIFSGSKMKQHWYDAGVNEQVAFEEFHDTIQKSGFKALLITDDLIQHQWNYYYGKEIPATMFRKKERVQRFCTGVIETYENNPEDVVIGGLWGIFLTMDTIPGFNDVREQVGVKYFVNKQARKEFVEHGFAVTEGR